MEFNFDGPSGTLQIAFALFSETKSLRPHPPSDQSTSVSGSDEQKSPKKSNYGTEISDGSSQFVQRNELKHCTPDSAEYKQPIRNQT